MASEQWLLNDTSVANNAYFTAVGSSYKLRNVSGGTYTRRTTSPTPYEGAGYYASGLSNFPLGRFYSSASVQLTGGNYYVDSYFYLTGYPAADVLAFVITGDDTDVLYTWVQINTNGSISISSYDDINGIVNWTTSTASDLPTSAWFRLQYRVNSHGVREYNLFKGSNINGTTPDVTASKNFSTQSPFSTGGPFEFQAFAVDNTGGSPAILYVDDTKFDDNAYPTRGIAHTAAATATGTATGTASMRNARVGAGTGTGTATGTGAASRGQSVTGSASVTASATAGMSRTQVIGASGTGTASGSAAGAITALITIDGAGTGTASATAGASSTQVFAGSATVTATGTADASIRPLVTVDGVGTVTATGATTASKQQTLAATATANASATAGLISITPITASATVTATATALALITTPGTLYGNAEKVAGLYGSSTKPTLTTRS
jgi:hypothetical protein